MSDEAETYSLPCGPRAPRHFQALAQLARRVVEIGDLVPGVDTELARRIDQFHAELAAYPVQEERI